MKKMIKLFAPKFNNKEIIAATNALKSSRWASGDGKGTVLEFEEKFLDYIQAKECVAVDNGTAALHLALNLLDIKEKEVLVPSLTFVTTAHSVLYNGGIPVFVDVDPQTLCMDSKDMKKKITKKTKAVVPMHYGGFPCEMNEIEDISKENSLHIVEDAAHACGSKYQGKKIGAKNELVCFSFHPVKNLAMPKGGAITINSKNSAAMKNRLNSLRWCGIDKRKGAFYDVTSLGFNYYMAEISAAIGIEQLKKLDKSNKARLKIAKRYYSELDTLQKMPMNEDCSYHLYWIRVKNRKEFMRNMYEKGIEVGAHYNPVHLMSYYDHKINLPVTEQVAKEVVTLPMHPNLTENDIDVIIKAANSFI
jgi:dTDP-4-amino-4,6-dideoxygalactose transaminase